MTNEALYRAICDDPEADNLLDALNDGFTGSFDELLSKWDAYADDYPGMRDRILAAAKAHPKE